ncbi:uncharacterized protein KIAA0040 homolog isoform X4 [Panthera leo]|uniref:uncharacterized protein KIAA0040 homolog isoform X4 n=1 Tax=Panthera leo TaxID=9689 RepID=UPI001C6A2B8C|nr:uncharacterized protein KIAA0040 homolog isoform X4 [Panthera leo]
MTGDRLWRRAARPVGGVFRNRGAGFRTGTLTSAGTPAVRRAAPDPCATAPVGSPPVDCEVPTLITPSVKPCLDLSLELTASSWLLP